MINKLRQVGIALIMNANGHPCTQPPHGDLTTCQSWLVDFTDSQENVDFEVDINNWLKATTKDLEEILSALNRVSTRQSATIVESFLYFNEECNLLETLEETLKQSMSKFVDCF